MENNSSPLIDAETAANITGQEVSAVVDAPVEGAVAQVQNYKSKGPDKQGFFWGTGRRKSSVARVRIKPGSGQMKVNGKKLDEYFTRTEHLNAVKAPLNAIESLGKFDIFVNVNGGGSSGQAGAIMLGVARALRDYDTTLIGTLRQAGYLTRDGRMKERKKYGQRGARRSFQFSKR